MDETHSLQSTSGDTGPVRPLREILGDAIRFWEPRRIPYNLVLTGVFLAWVGFSWPHFRQAFTLQHDLALLLLAALANVCYCAAYLADVPMQFSFSRADWRRWRWGIWAAGMLFAILIANYWIADEIYPYVN